jgi:hypothetical protein
MIIFIAAPHTNTPVGIAKLARWDRAMDKGRDRFFQFNLHENGKKVRLTLA